MDQSLRQKYWRIYYGDEEFENRLDKLAPAESKRLSIVSARMKELNNERIKQTSRHKQFEELNEIVINHSLSTSPVSSPSSYLFKFRRSHSTSIPAEIPQSNSPPEHRSYDVLCQTPLCKPQNRDLIENLFK